MLDFIPLILLDFLSSHHRPPPATLVFLSGLTLSPFPFHQQPGSLFGFAPLMFNSAFLTLNETRVSLQYDNEKTICHIRLFYLPAPTHAQLG